jgi:curved DNA-binding protein
VVGDETKRKAYDALGANWKAGQQFTPPPGWDFGSADSPFRGRARGPQGGFGNAAGAGAFSDFFSQLFGGPGGMGGMGGGGFQDRGGETPSTRARLAIDVEDSYQGAQRQISVGGRALKVRIPQGVVPGQTIRLAGQGPQGGDLLLEIEFNPHAQFRIEGHDVHSTLPITPWEAALGSKLAVPTLGGSVELNLPANSRSGQKMRLKARGLPGAKPGDQFVTLQIVVPPTRNDDDRAAFEALAAHFADFNPRA